MYERVLLGWQAGVQPRERVCLEHENWTWQLVDLLFSDIPGPGQRRGAAKEAGTASPQPPPDKPLTGERRGP